MSYPERAKNWFERATGESDPFVKFLLLYIAAEALAKTEGGGVKSYLKQAITQAAIQNDVAQTLFDELQQQPLQNLNPHYQRAWTGQLISPEDREGVVEFIVCARNNLFHGDKGRDEGRDLLIIDMGNKVLEPIIRVACSKAN